MPSRSRSSETQTPVTFPIWAARLGYLASLLLLMAGIVAEVYFIGAMLLVNASAVIQHQQLGQLLAVVPVVILVTAFLSRLPRRLLILSGLPNALRALHAVNALVMFGVVEYLAKAAWKLLRDG
jgi:hypothetical protein